jgi:hypothetical protein
VQGIPGFPQNSDPVSPIDFGALARRSAGMFLRPEEHIFNLLNNFLPTGDFEPQQALRKGIHLQRAEGLARRGADHEQR